MTACRSGPLNGEPRDTDVGSADIDVAKALPLVEHRHDDVEGETAFTGLAAARLAWSLLVLLVIGLAAIAEARRRDRGRA